MLNLLITRPRCDWLFQVEPKQLLRAFIPLDSSGAKLDRCRRLQIFAISSQCWMILLAKLTSLLTKPAQVCGASVAAASPEHLHQHEPGADRGVLGRLDVRPSWVLLHHSLRGDEGKPQHLFFHLHSYNSLTPSVIMVAWGSCRGLRGVQPTPKIPSTTYLPRFNLCPSPTDGWTCVPKENNFLTLII